MFTMLALALLSTSSPPPDVRPPASNLQSALRAKDQALLDAIAPGDRTIWDRTLSADAVYVDENGLIMNRSEFLAALEPLPQGTSGHIQITDYRLTVNGDSAFVIHKDDEFEDYHGQPLRARYLMTETWLRRGGEWKLAMIHAYVQASDPPAIKVSAADLDAYVGRFRAASDLTYVIRRDGDHLVGGREGRDPHPLLVEIKNVLFSPGQPRVRLIFQRDAAGHVTGYIDRREGEDIKWTLIR
jgi:ketosteroid isomerase-like protein